MNPDRSPREPAAPSQDTAAADATHRAAVSEAVARFQAGERREESFRWLYQRFFSPVDRFFARKGMSPEDCLDLTQETFLGIYNGLDGFRSDARFETWLYRVATTTYLKRLRTAATAKRAGHNVPLEDAMFDEPNLGAPADQLTEVLTDERARMMAEAVERLPGQMRKCLTLRLYHQLAYKEIAEVMKLNIETVKVHLFKARKKLKQDLSGYSLKRLDSETETA